MKKTVGTSTTTTCLPFESTVSVSSVGSDPSTISFVVTSTFVSSAEPFCKHNSP